MKSKNIKVTVGVLVIVAAIAYLIFSGMGTATAAYTISVEDAKSTTLDTTKYYRLDGKLDVAKAEFNADKKPVELTFELYSEGDPSKTVKVVYNNVKPDNFAEATGAIIEGRFKSDGTFHADNLMLKCPSKYEQSNEESTWTKFLKAIGIK